MNRYSVFPLYGDAVAIVVDAENLRAALEAAFNSKIDSIATLHAHITDERIGETALFYGVFGALCMRAKVESVVCSATVISYSLRPGEQTTSDVASISLLAKITMLH